MNKIKLTVSTPNGTFFEGHVENVNIKTPEGYICLQHGRVPFISTIEISAMYINESENKRKVAAIGGGLIFAEKTYIDIFTDDIQWKKELNKLDIENIIKQVKHQIETKETDLLEKEKLELELKKAFNKLTIIGGD